MHATALGKVLLAHHPFVATELSKSELPAYTAATITDPERLERELDRVREQGWAADLGELVADQVSWRRRSTIAADRSPARWASSGRQSV